MPTSEQRTSTGFTEPVNAQVGTERREFQAFAPAPLPPKGIDISPPAFSEFDDNSFALADLARAREASTSRTSALPMTSLCARLYGQRSARRRAERALAAAQEG